MKTLEADSAAPWRQVHLTSLLIKQVGYLFLQKERAAEGGAAALSPALSPPLLPAPDATARPPFMERIAADPRGDCQPRIGLHLSLSHPKT